MNQSSTLLTYSSEVNNLAKKALVQLIEQATGRSKLERIYAYALEAIKRGESIWSAALHGLQVTLDYDASKLKTIPASGSLIFIANHPYGVLDGLAICHLASQARCNFRIFISKALCREERIAPYILPIDFDGGEQAIQTNLTSMRKAVETLQEEGAIIIFPGGGISTALTPFGPVGDLEWKLSAAKLIHQTKATVIPIFFHGQNSHLFHLVSFFSLSLRLSLIIHELNKMMSQTLRISIGDPIPYEQLAAHKSRKALTEYLRKVIYTLGGTPDPGAASLEWKENWERNLDRMKY